MAILLIVLFILQLISFYLIVLLNSKIARFKELENRQNQLIREMDDSIGAYLMEMKEENDRLIKELSVVQRATSSKDIEKSVAKEHPKSSVIQERNEKVESVLLEENKPVQPELSPKAVIPKTLVANAYSKQKAPTVPVSKRTKQVDQENHDHSFAHLSVFEREVMSLHKEGKTVEEIAKKTQKGKTEIELLIKFHS